MYRRTDGDESIAITKKGDKFIPAKIINKSVVGYCVETSERFPVEREAAIWATLNGYRPIPLVVIWRRHVSKKSTLFGLRALEFVARYKLVAEREENERLTGRFRVVRNKEGQIVWNELLRIHDQANNAIDATGDLISVVAEASNEDVKPAKPKVLKIAFSSPGETIIRIDFGVELIMRAVTNVIGKVIAENNPEDLKISENELAFANVRRAISFRAETRKGKFTDLVIEALRDDVLTRVLRTPKIARGLFVPGSLERGILGERVIPSIT